MNRRQLIKLTGSGVVALTAGCSGNSNSPITTTKESTATITEESATTTTTTEPTGKITELVVDENTEYGELNPIQFDVKIANFAVIEDPQIRAVVESDAGTETKTVGLKGNEQKLSITPAESTSTNGTTVSWSVQLLRKGEVVDSRSGEIDYE